MKRLPFPLLLALCPLLASAQTFDVTVELAPPVGVEVPPPPPVDLAPPGGPIYVIQGAGAESDPLFGTKFAQSIGAYDTRAVADTRYRPADYVPAWGDIPGKPTTFPPSAHTHDDRYFTETEADARYLQSFAETDPVAALHALRTDNPHGVTKAQVGLGAVPNTDATNPANITQSSGYRFTTDAEKAAWNAKANAAHTHTLSAITDAGTAAALNVPASGNASAGEVVKGNDTRLSDARTPTAHGHAIADVSGLQTALDGKQPLAAPLTEIAGLSPSNDDIIQRKAGVWARRTLANLKTDLGYTTTEISEGTNLYFTNTRASAAAPVQSVNGQTGAVSLSIPAAQVNSDWNAGSGVAQILNKPTLGTMASQNAGALSASLIFGTDNSFSFGSQSFRASQVWSTRGSFGDAAALDANAVVQFNATNRGVMQTRLTQAQRTAMSSPGDGIYTHQTDNTQGWWGRIAGTWRRHLHDGDIGTGAGQVAAGDHTHPNATPSVAGFLSASDKTKLDGIATGATANSTDAQLRDRSTHTGTQTASTISDFNSAARGAISLTTTGTSGAATYNSSTGVLNVPNYATGGGGGETEVVQAANVTATTTTGINTDLTFTATANTTYRVIVVGTAISAATGGAMQVSWSLPSGTAAGTLTLNNTNFSMAGASGTWAGPTTGTNPATTSTTLNVLGIVRVGATGGAVSLQIRRGASSTQNVSLEAGSRLYFR